LRDHESISASKPPHLIDQCLFRERNTMAKRTCAGHPHASACLDQALINQMRGLLAEYGLVTAQGAANVRRAIPQLLEDAPDGFERRIPSPARRSVR